VVVPLPVLPVVVPEPVVPVVVPEPVVPEVVPVVPLVVPVVPLVVPLVVPVSAVVAPVVEPEVARLPFRSLSAACKVAGRARRRPAMARVDVVFSFIQDVFRSCRSRRPFWRVRNSRDQAIPRGLRRKTGRPEPAPSSS
jgi:hypothetical protein